MDYQKLKMMSVQGIKDLIKDVLHNKDFHPDEILYIISYMISYCLNLYRYCIIYHIVFLWISYSRYDIVDMIKLA
jgi:hypothetical protein